ncbi:C4-dicarboxylate ABC transporter permease [Acuticoccus sediminis]|uniref:TRAP transporter large permease protein n=1 Tax=Acuticoccus sediminis TaxID=2184697 RepID=A0A8B2NWC8_9HYPH|nr:TRAP transporter large permease [Acuticoccus sediminis]RAI02103.1 C4-dicarboxylate ABC transporter permease [Acuticoccus sediminis]
MIYAILAGGFVITAVIGLPIGIGLALTGLAILQFAVGGATDLAVNAMWDVFNNFTLSAVPLFIIMGEILLASGVSSRLYNAMSPFFGRIPGKLLHTNIAVCALFGAVSGASTSTAAAVGSVAFPELLKRGYDPKIVVGTLAAGGTLGLLIPPSLSLLIYGATMQVSIGQLFLAGIIPGILFALGMMALIVLLTLTKRGLTPDAPDAGPGLGGALLGLLRIWPIGILVFSVLGTIYLGIATPTEAAGLGVVASIGLGFLWGDLTVRGLLKALRDSVEVFVSISMVILGAVVLAQAISIVGLPFELMTWIKTLGLSPTMLLAVVAIFYLVLGCFFDGISLMLMTLPIVFPVMTSVGYDPVWLGVVITVLIEVGMLTPPVGMNLYILTGVSGNRVSLIEAAAAAAPFWVLLLLGVAVLAAVPQLALMLPQAFY